jgi:hypothetical protein
MCLSHFVPIKYIRTKTKRKQNYMRVQMLYLAKFCMPFPTVGVSINPNKFFQNAKTCLQGVEIYLCEQVWNAPK